MLIGSAVAVGTAVIIFYLKRLLVVPRKVEVLENRMGTVEKRMDSLDNRMDALDNRMDSLDNRMGTLDKKVDGLFSLINWIKESLIHKNIISPSIKPDSPLKLRNEAKKYWVTLQIWTNFCHNAHCFKMLKNSRICRNSISIWNA